MITAGFESRPDIFRLQTVLVELHYPTTFYRERGGGKVGGLGLEFLTLAKNYPSVVLIFLSVRLGASGYDGFYVESLKVSSQRGECEIRTHALKHPADFGGRWFLPKLCPKSCFDSVAVLPSG